MTTPKKSILIIGSGWAGSTLSSSLSSNLYDITVISPESTTPYTPLLASAACGLYDFSLVETPIRHTSKPLTYLQARVLSISFKTTSVTCIPAFPDSTDNDTFTVHYDILILSPGCTVHTFATPGVTEHALSIRTARDARTVATRIKTLFERASMPFLSESEQRALLHFVIVGAGPTGVEISSEMSDLFSGSYAKLYPHLADKVSISIHDVAPNVLSSFDSRLREYAMGSFGRRGVEVCTGSHIQSVDEKGVVTKEKGRIEAGCVIWATGNKATSLVDSIEKEVALTSKQKRILTDSYLRVYAAPSEDEKSVSIGGEDPAPTELIPHVYALGDAADIFSARLPTTAEVACQKAAYLAHMLNKSDGFSHPFEYRQANLVAYLGQADGVVSGKMGKDYSGAQAWIAWRSKNFTWTRTWRQKAGILVSWVFDLVLGRADAPR